MPMHPFILNIFFLEYTHVSKCKFIHISSTYVMFSGNDLLHSLTSLKPQELRVDMQRFNGEKAYAVYSNFSVVDEASKYKLKANGYSGNAGR